MHPLLSLLPGPSLPSGPRGAVGSSLGPQPRAECVSPCGLEGQHDFPSPALFCKKSKYMLFTLLLMKLGQPPPVPLEGREERDLHARCSAHITERWLIPILQMGKPGSERLSHIPKVTQLVVWQSQDSNRGWPQATACGFFPGRYRPGPEHGLHLFLFTAVFLRVAQKPTRFSIPGSMCLLTCRFLGCTKTHPPVISEEGPWNLHF